MMFAGSQGRQSPARKVGAVWAGGGEGPPPCMWGLSPGCSQPGAFVQWGAALLKMSAAVGGASRSASALGLP